jgi:ABC-type multidrug transport system ATPase subunit
MERAPTVHLKRARTRQRIELSVEPGRPHVLGSGAGCDTVIDDPGVEARHAELSWTETGFRVAPVGDATVSLNGQPVRASAAVTPGDWMTLGRTLFQIGDASTVTALTPSEGVSTVPGGEPAVSRPAEPRPAVLSVGRMPDSDIRIDSPIVSRRHARLVREAGGAVLEDLRSTNGTFVNGERVVGRRAGLIRLDARGLEKTVRDSKTGAPKRILQDIDLSVLPGEFTVIFGTSGSGKSTLIDALNGRRPASGGHVLYNGSDLYGSFGLFGSTIGYVPQQDIVHRRITVRRAVTYAGRLRLPEDTTATEIDEHVARVLDRVGLSDKHDQPIDTPSPLSGGQLKRVSVAVELVSNPSILFLDEATTGLDAGTDRRMMSLFAELARDQKTVVCVTHTLENIDCCDLVLLLHQGRLVYFGPPGGAIGHFGIDRLARVYETLESRPADHWADHYHSSELHEEFVDKRLATARGGGDSSATLTPGVGSRRWFDWRQAGILTRRYLDLLLADRRALALLLLPAPAIGLLVGYVWGSEGRPGTNAQSQICFTLVLSMIWLGCFNAAREIVKELPVYRRERAVNLGLGPYVLSKLGPLAALCGVQTLAMLGIAELLAELPGAFLDRALLLFASGMAGTGMGLTISALVDTNDKAIATVPLLLVPQLIFSNVFALPPTATAIAKATMVSYWGFDAMKASLVDVKIGQPIIPPEGSYHGDLAVIGGLFMVFLVTVFVGLRLKDRRR